MLIVVSGFHEKFSSSLRQPNGRFPSRKTSDHGESIDFKGKGSENSITAVMSGLFEQETIEWLEKPEA
jgi:hypothetical protein